MKEIKQIVKSYHELLKSKKKCALATVVHVEGSSYRRSGARMLIAEDGRLTGAISGGCLEGDAMRKALFAMNQDCPTLVTYDTMDEEDAIIGIGLGCNGIIKVLIEPISYHDESNALELLKKTLDLRQNCVLVTTFNEKNKLQEDSGTKMFIGENGEIKAATNFLLSSDFQINAATRVFEKKSSEWNISIENGVEQTYFYEYIRPSVSLVIVGAGNDVQPLALMADILGWDTTIVDGRANYATQERFTSACQIVVAKPEQVLSQVALDDLTFFALMTHNYNYDKALLYHLVKAKINYTAMLGPRKKLDRILSEFASEGRELTTKEISTIYSPAGLDIGAETSEEIALSILSEIQAFVKEKSSASLRYKSMPIHN